MGWGMGSGEGLGGCHACIKYLMFGFNFLFWLVGCALVGLGIWVLVDDSFKDLAASKNFEALQFGGVALIVVGGVIMVVGFFGCCGAIRESQCLLVMFFICMLILFVALVAGGVVCLMYKESMITIVTEGFQEAVDGYDAENPNEFVDLVQATFECCGVNGPKDYTLKGKSVPDSCGDNMAELAVDALTATGCGSTVKEKLDDYSILAAGVALGAGVVMLLGMIFSMMLCCAIRDSD